MNISRIIPPSNTHISKGVNKIEFCDTKPKNQTLTKTRSLTSRSYNTQGISTLNSFRPSPSIQKNET